MKTLIDRFKALVAYIDSLSHDFGFSSIGEFVKESLFFSSKYFSVYAFSFTVSGIFSFLKEYVPMISEISDYLEMNIYSPSRAIMLLFVITVADVWFGTTKAVSDHVVTGPKEKEMVQGNKLIRSFSRFSVQVFFVSFLFNLSNLYMALNVEWVVHALMLAFIIGTFISTWNNAYIIGWLDREVHGFVLSFFDLKKIFSKFNRNKQDLYDISYKEAVDKAAEKLVEEREKNKT